LGDVSIVPDAQLLGEEIGDRVYGLPSTFAEALAGFSRSLKGSSDIKSWVERTFKANKSLSRNLAT